MKTWETTIAVGDIHGYLPPLVQLVETMLKRYGRFKFVTLGDYIDRGPDSAGVIDYLISLSQNPDVDLVPLMGNHEEMMIDVLIRGRYGMASTWMENGGHEAMESYGYDGTGPLPALPESHIEFLKRLYDYYDDGKRLFVHAGVDPRRATFEEQTPEIMRWIRGPFLESRHQLDRVVVHGHTPHRQAPDVYDWRINLDACVFKSGNIAAAVFDDAANDRKFFLASAKGVEEVARESKAPAPLWPCI